MKGLRQITPYVAGEQPEIADLIKLNTNENPYGIPPKVQQVLKEFDSTQLKRYSSLTNQSLKKALGRQHSLAPENFIIGNGSDEILAFAFLAFFNSKEPVLFPDLTYGFYQIWCELFQIPYRKIPVEKDFTIDFSAYPQQNGGIIIANPNAPTSLYKEPQEIEALLQANKESVVIVDEAYIDFGGESVAGLIEKYENLFVTRTFSKSYSLAGARVGYGMGQPKLIQVIEAVKHSFNPYSVDTLSESLATAAVESSDYFQKINLQIQETRDWTMKELQKLGYQVLPSATNFVFFTHPNIEMQQLSEYLRTKNILVRYFAEELRIQQYIRLTIGTKEEMQQVLDQLPRSKEDQK